MIILLRILFILISMGISLLYYFDASFTAKIIAVSASGFVSLFIIILIEYISHTFSIRMLLSVLFGLFLVSLWVI